MINFFYKAFCSIYSFLVGKLEEIFFKSKNLDDKINNLNKYGFYKLKINKKLEINKKSFHEISVNNYFKRLIVSKDDIAQLIKNLFIENELAKKITELTGYKYSIGFLLCYKTLHVPKTEEENSIYANHWHQDKPYSSNTLKIIFPIQKFQRMTALWKYYLKKSKLKKLKKKRLFQKFIKLKWI